MILSLVYLVGFLLFLRVYWWSARLARRYSDTYYSVEYLAERFAPSLLAIAAGYAALWSDRSEEPGSPVSQESGLAGTDKAYVSQRS